MKKQSGWDWIQAQIVWMVVIGAVIISAIGWIFIYLIIELLKLLL